MYLIKGFSTLLQCHDNRLIYVQRAILDLITNLDTTEAFCAFLKLFMGTDPPVELLLQKFAKLATSRDDINVLVEMKFPTIKDYMIIETEPLTNDRMQQIQMRSAVVAPLDSVPFLPWKMLGFTVSLWIKFSDFPDRAGEGVKEAKRLKPIQNSTHLFSIGSQKLMLSIQIDNADPTLLHIQLIRPKKSLARSTSLQSCEKIRGNYPSGMQSMLHLTKSALRSNWNLANLINRDGTTDSGASYLQTSINIHLPTERWTFMTFTVIPGDCEIALEIFCLISERDTLQESSLRLFFSDNINTIEIIRSLQEYLLFSFSAENPSIVMEYVSNGNFGTPLEVTTGKQTCKSNRVNSFYTAVLQTGGLSSLLFLFARTVELTDSSRLQAEALRILLNVAHSNVELYTEFIKGEYLNTIGCVLRSSKCCKDLHMLQAVMDTAFDQPIMENVDGAFVLTSNNSSLIYPELIIFIINNYNDWHGEDGEVLEFTLMIIKSLTTRSTKDINMQQLMNIDLLPSLINFCKVFFVGATPPINITAKSAKLIVEILSAFGPTPPTTSFIDEIAKLLLLLHEPSYTYITQDRANYYYLLSKTTPSPPKFNKIAKTAERIKSKFHITNKGNMSPYNLLRRRMRSVSMDCVYVESESKCGDFDGQKENFHETLNEIVDLAKSDNRINKLSMRDVKKLGKNMHIEKILKGRRSLQKSRSYSRNSLEFKKSAAVLNHLQTISKESETTSTTATTTTTTAKKCNQRCNCSEGINQVDAEFYHYCA
uniref:Uncharacterized protein n=1 Tax=Lutzomyia longipalpis TaxID=7200 RepID=A0A1B0CC58_LUTLO